MFESMNWYKQGVNNPSPGMPLPALGYHNKWSALSQKQGLASTLPAIIDLGVSAGTAKKLTGCHPRYRQQGSKALTKSEVLYRLLSQDSTDLISRHTPEGIFLYASPACCTLLGYGPDELIGRAACEFFHPQDLVALSQFHSNLLNFLEMNTVSYRIRRRDGDYIWLESTTTPVYHPETDVLEEIVAISQDVTKQKQAEEALQEREHQCQMLTDNVPGMIYQFLRRTDGSVSFPFVSSGAREIYELEPLQIQQNAAAVIDLIHPDDRASFKNSVAVSAETLQPWRWEGRIVLASGKLKWLQAASRPELKANGDVLWDGMLIDITQRKQAEAELLEQKRLAADTPSYANSHTLLTRLSTLAAKVGAALAQGGTLPARLQVCTEAIVRQLNITSAGIWILNSASGQLEQQAASGQSISLNPDLINLVAQAHQPYLSSELVEDFQSSLLPDHFSGYPLVVEDRLVGIMTLLSNQSLTQEAHGILGWVANVLAEHLCRNFAVASDRYGVRSEPLCRPESLLFDLTVQIRNSLELDTILVTVVQSIRSVLQIDRCQFLWYQSHETSPYWEVVNEARNPLLPSDSCQYAIADAEPFATQLLNQQIIQVDDVKTFSDPILRQFLLEQGVASFLSIPIKTQAGKIGVINCTHCTGVRPWNNSEVELLQAVVAQVAIAIDQAELYAQAQQAAQTAQEKAKKLEQTLHQVQATQIQLVQNEKLSSLGHLVAGVAHEINNPVNFIHNNLSYASAYFYDILTLLRLYQEHYPNPPAAITEQAELVNIDFIAQDLPKLLSSMQRGSDRIRSIVLSLRNFSRVNEVQMKKVDLHEGIENTLLILQHRLQAKEQYPEIQVFKEYGNLPSVECYPGQLNQVFMNILSNAIEALTLSEVGSPENPLPAITIRTSILDGSDSVPNSLPPRTGQYRDTTHNSQSVVIQITDNGPGMTEVVKARLFEPFFTTKPVGQGTGLGLSISYQIVVDHHQGFLTCTSAPGQGTEFWIEIPIEQNS